MDNRQKEVKKIVVDSDHKCEFLYVSNGFAYCHASMSCFSDKTVYREIIPSEVSKCCEIWQSCPDYEQERYRPDWQAKQEV